MNAPTSVRPGGTIDRTIRLLQTCGGRAPLEAIAAELDMIETTLERNLALGVKNGLVKLFENAGTKWCALGDGKPAAPPPAPPKPATATKARVDPPAPQPVSPKPDEVIAAVTESAVRRKPPSIEPFDISIISEPEPQSRTRLPDQLLSWTATREYQEKQLRDVNMQIERAAAGLPIEDVELVVDETPAMAALRAADEEAADAAQSGICWIVGADDPVRFAMHSDFYFKIEIDDDVIVLPPAHARALIAYAVAVRELGGAR